jgi:hypothetical protein
MVQEPKPSKKLVVLRDERDSKGLCIHCGEPPKEGQRRKLGNCGRCYQRYRGQLIRLSDEKQVLFEAECIKACRIMPDRQGETLDIQDPVYQIANEVKS